MLGGGVVESATLKDFTSYMAIHKIETRLKLHMRYMVFLLFKKGQKLVKL